MCAGGKNVSPTKPPEPGKARPRLDVLYRPGRSPRHECKRAAAGSKKFFFTTAPARLAAAVLYILFPYIPDFPRHLGGPALSLH